MQLDASDGCVLLSVHLVEGWTGYDADTWRKLMIVVMTVKMISTMMVMSMMIMLLQEPEKIFLFLFSFIFMRYYTFYIRSAILIMYKE